MIAPFFLTLMVFQQFDLNRPIDHVVAKQEAEFKAEEAERQRGVALARAEFAQRFDNLVFALQAFEAEYRKSRGQAWPKKQADELSKAMHKLQSSEAWKQYHSRRERESK